MEDRYTNKKIKFFTCCIPIKGYYASIIMDLQRNQIKYIPHDLIDIVFGNKDKTIPEIIEELDYDDIETFHEYLDFLIENEFAFLLDKDEEQLFPQLSLMWDVPCFISNVVFILSDDTKAKLFDICEQLNTLLCTALHIVSYGDINFFELKQVIELFSKTSIESINISINYNESFLDENMNSLFETFSQISSINFYGTKKGTLKKYNLPIKTTTIQLKEFPCFGKINKTNFVSNIEFFTESQIHNNCLNRKLCIDSNGYIKNCPSMKEHYGHISEINLKEVVEKDEFKKYWNISKDKIDVCKDCEFRYICTDCRAFIKNPENIYSQPANCKYNPYICKWKGEKGYISVEECGNYTKKRGFVPNHRKITNINNKLWEE
jgi:SPASM domain peptide maturase of grasp-with-spasm system